MVKKIIEASDLSREIFRHPKVVNNFSNLLEKDDFVALKNALLLNLKHKHHDEILSNSLNIIYRISHQNKYPLYREMRPLFNLAASRSGPDSIKNVSVFSAKIKKSQYSPKINKDLSAKYDVGYLVFIPVPYLDEYKKIGDRSPLDIVEIYLKAASKKNTIRILLALNIKNNVFSTKEKSISLKQKVSKAADYWNKLFHKKNYSAWVEPVIWGFDDYESELIREFLSLPKSLGRHAVMSFPYATARSYLLQTDSCNVMQQELSLACKTVYYLTGDADIVALNLNKKTESMLGLASKYLTGLNYSPVRYGGNTVFSNDDIYLNLKKLSCSSTDYIKSILMTQLCHCVDFSFRKIMFDADRYLAYFSEIGTFIRSDFLSKDNLYNNMPLLNSLNSSNTTVMNDGGDLMCMITRMMRSQHLQSHQHFQSNRSGAVVTSSRHELVNVLSHKSSSFDLADMKAQFCSLKNMQLTPSQMNSRFNNAGYNSQKYSLHDFISGLDLKQLPFAVYFLTRESAPKGGLDKSRINDSYHVASNVDLSAYKPQKRSCLDFMSRFNDVAERPSDNLHVVNEVKVDGLVTNPDNNKFKLMNGSLIKLFQQVEVLLRWAFAEGSSIMRKDFKVKSGFLSSVNSEELKAIIKSNAISKEVESSFSNMVSVNLII